MLVSILINNRNYGRFLRQCVDSALNQTYGDVEVIVYDDGSSDSSVEILRGYGERIRLIVGQGSDFAPAFRQGNAINQAFSASRGDVVCLLDSDDVFLPGKAETVVRAIRDRDDVILVQHPFEEIEESGRPSGVVKPYLSNKDLRVALYRTHSFAGLFTQTSGLTFRRRYLETVLPIVPDRFGKIWPDVRLTRLALFSGAILTIPTALAQHRMHDQNDSGKLQDDAYYADVLVQMYAFFNEHAAEYGWPPLDPERSVTRPGLKGIRRFAAQLRASDGWVERGRLTLRLMRRALGPGFGRASARDREGRGGVPNHPGVR